MNKLCHTIFLLCCLSGFLTGKDQFRRIAVWQHDIPPLGFITHSIIDKDDHIILGAFGPGRYVISANNIKEYGPFGQGPGDLTTCMAIFPFKEDMAFVELPEKIKIFTKKNGTYVWKETRWLKRGRYSDFVREGLFFKNKWFLAGAELLNFPKKPTEYSHLKVLNEKGDFIKHIITARYSTNASYGELNYFLLEHQDQLFYMTDNTFSIKVICPEKLTVIREITLKKPAFYKPMPASFYVTTKEHRDLDKLKKTLEYWFISYSRITKAVLEDSHLVLQIRTCNDDMKKFAVLFYDLEQFDLKETILTNDLFLGARNGKYYFFASGDPGLDEGADDCIINIYHFGDQDEKR